ncbi:hypothetical protein N752_25740 [Desulforamulus aquiferis]|nr:accessory gene regulator B family protein [Desulforamulus aquiferis]RYD02357.1 hypothetical protein N752_25740 [Desulforamulus aquiferis]
MMDKIIVNYLKKNLDINNDQEQIVKFAVQLIENTITSIGAVILVSLLLGNLQETMIVLGSSVCMRLAAGGPHCSTSLRCTLAGALVFPVLGFIPKYIQLQSYSFILFPIVVSFLSIVKYAPAEAPGKPLTNPEYNKKMYRISIILVVLISVLSLSLFVNQKMFQ